jgi:hypothetical protein
MPYILCYYLPLLPKQIESSFSFMFFGWVDDSGISVWYPSTRWGKSVFFGELTHWMSLPKPKK